MKKLCIATIGILGTCLLSTHANAASFDCNKATTWIEKTICTNTELSDLDEAMAKNIEKISTMQLTTKTVKSIETM